MTQTSIEWLIEQFKDYDCTPASNNDEYVIVIPQWIFNAKRDEALEMHKQEIIDTYLLDELDSGKKYAEQYYQETFKKD